MDVPVVNDGATSRHALAVPGEGINAELRLDSSRTARTLANRMRVIAICVVITWLIAVGIGMWAITDYSNLSGASGEVLAEWPSRCSIPRVSDHKTLLMFVHPRCPCSRASVHELARILARTSGEVDAHVLVFQPFSETNDWSRTDLWDSATSISGVHVTSDADAATATLFNVRTSGHVLLYGNDGQLLFSGGITAGRGHEGANRGHKAVVANVLGKEPATGSCPVFGCPIIPPPITHLR